MKIVPNIVVLADGDNVGVAVRDIEAADAARAANGRSAIAGEPIPLGHKIALRAIAEGERIIRFGVPVGIAIAQISAGSLVHVHNVASQYLNNDDDHYE